MVSYSTSGIESDPSDPFTIVFKEAAALEPVINLTTKEGALAVDIDATASTGAITRYSWNFSDGSSTDTDAVTSHTFAAAGTYTVSLTILDANGATRPYQLTNHPQPGAGDEPDTYGRSSCHLACNRQRTFNDYL